MIEFVTGLFDTTGFVPRGSCGTWTDELRWVHVGSDLFIWLAYVSIPLVLLYFTRRRDLPYPRLFLLFALFILACGFTHLVEALTFEYPLYRLSGAMKVLTAVASWATVMALIPVVPRAMGAVAAANRPPGPPGGGPGDTALHRLAAPPARERVNDYTIAVLAAVLALLVRAAIDPLVRTDHFYVLSLLAVVFVSWQAGFGPAIATLLVSMAGMVYFFIEPRYDFVVRRFGDQLATAVFFFCGVCCAGLGEAQRRARRATRAALAVALERKDELEGEVARRRDAEATLRAFYDSAPICMGVVEPLPGGDVRHVYDNPAACRFFGIDPDGTAGRRATELGTPPKALATWVSKYWESDAARKPVHFECDYPGPDGPRWLAATVSPLPGGASGRRLFCYAADDVTDRRRGEEAVRESEERFRTMADSAPALIWLAERDRRRTYFNRTWLEFTGRPADREADHGWAENVHPDDRGAYLAEYAAAFDARRSFSIEYRLRRHDGEYRWVLARGTPRFTPAGEFAGLIGLCVDVTDQKLAADALKASEERFRTLTEAIPQIVWNADAAGEVTYFNRRWLDYTGEPLDRARGRGWLGAVHPDDRDGVFAAWRETVETAAAGPGDRFSRELRLRHGETGEYRWFLTVAVPLRRPDGAIDQWIGSMADIHDQKTAAEAIAESEEKFRQLAESIPQLAWMTDADGYIFWYNQRWYDYTGTTFDQMKGWGWELVHDPAELPRVVEKFKAHLASGEPWEDTFPLRRQDGEFRWHLSRARPIRDAAGKVTRWFGTNTDVTAQRQMEQALRDAAERFRTLTEAVPQMVWTADPKGAVTFFNRRWDEYTGLPLAAGQEALGWRDVIHPDDAEQLRVEWQLAVAGEPDRFTQEFRLKRAADGAYRWMLSAAVPLRGPTAAVAEWVGSITDIDDQKRQAETLEQTIRERTAALIGEVEDRKRAEDEVRTQREFLDAILANVADGIVACDAAGTLTLFNRAAREFHGLDAESVGRDGWADRYSLFRADGQTRLTPDEIPLVRALGGERVRDFEFVIAPADRPRRTVLASGQPLLDDRDRNLGAVVSMRDITERREAERQLGAAADELQRTNTELARSNEELEKFAYVASHDLQEPLRKIQAFGDRLRTKYRAELPEGGKEYVDRMLTSAGRMRRLIDDLLTFSRVTTQARPFARVDLGKLVGDVVSDLDERIEEAGGIVTAGEMPEIDADPSQLRQLFQNLVVNAIKFHRPGVPPVVGVSAEAVGVPLPTPDDVPVPACRVTVRDNGIGFDEKYLDRIFQVFQRLHGRDEYEGTGVGLAICRKIVERHGGTITARSRVGEGAAFVVTLPARHTQPEAPPGPAG